MAIEAGFGKDDTREHRPTLPDEAPKMSKSIGDELIPPEGNDEVGVKVFAILEEILLEKENQGLPAKWLRNYELGRGKHWRSASKKVPLRKANLLHLFRQRTVNNLTDNNPTFNVRQVGKVEEEGEDNLGKLHRQTEFWWNETEQQDLLESSVRNGETYGCCIEKMTYSQKGPWDIGEAETVIVDPFHFGFYPTKIRDPRDIQTKAEAVLYYYPISIRELRRKYPDKADDIKPDEDVIKELGDDRLEATGHQRGAQGILTTFANVVKNMINFGGRESHPGEETLCAECWVRDYTMEEVPEMMPAEGGNGEMVPTGEMVEKMKYPGGIRYVKVCSGGLVTLEDRRNPSINPDLPEELTSQTYLYDNFPFSMTNSIKDTITAWGMDDFQQLEDLQVEFNKALSQWTNYVQKALRLKLLNPTTSGVDNKDLTTGPSVVRPTSPNHGISFLDPPKPAIDVMQTVELWKDLFFMLAGIFELDQAKAPGRDVIAYKAIAALLERAATMLRGKIRAYSRLIRDRGRMYISMVQNWYTEERWITTEIDGEDQSEPITGIDLIMPTNLSVVSGSTLPQSKVQQREEAITLYREGAIDSEALLKAMEYPDRKDIINRMKAGPFGELFAKMGAMGVPDEILQVLSEVAQMDEKEFESELEKGAIPQIPIGQDLEMPEDTAEEAEVRKIDAEIRKLEAEVGKIKAEAEAEYAEAEAKRAGIQYDAEQQKIERAKAVAALEQARQGEKIKGLEGEIKHLKQKKQRGKRGLKSDNK